MEENKNFSQASTSRSHEKTLETSVTEEVDPSILVTFLKNLYEVTAQPECNRMVTRVNR